MLHNVFFVVSNEHNVMALRGGASSTWIIALCKGNGRALKSHELRATQRQSRRTEYGMDLIDGTGLTRQNASADFWKQKNCSSSQHQNFDTALSIRPFSKIYVIEAGVGSISNVGACSRIEQFSQSRLSRKVRIDEQH
jgi:hypothetical protein